MDLKYSVGFVSNLIGPASKGRMMLLSSSSSSISTSNSNSNSNFMSGSLKLVSPLLASYKGTSQSQGGAAITLVRGKQEEETAAANYYSYGSYDGSKLNGTKPQAQGILFSSLLLDAFDDEYGGVVVNPDKLPFDTNLFASVLASSLSIWRSQDKKGIWLKLPLEKCDLVPIAVKEGFEYHHAEKGYIMMTYWIPNEPCMLPANASHQVGVGGFVMNHKNQVLVVQEKHCAPELVGLWKLPTGFILESEEIFEGAVREVKEETGIDTEFMEVIAFRHAHNVAFEKSDLFFICMLRPVSSEIKIDDLEVQAAKWMALREFVEQPLIKGDMMFKKIIDMCIAKIGKRYCGLSVHKVVSKFDNRLSSLYYNVVDDATLDCCSTSSYT